MLECRACVLRCIRAIAGDTTKPRSVLRRQALPTPRLHIPPYRRHASTAVATKKDRSDDLVPGKQPMSENGNESGKTPNGIAIRDKKALTKELRYLGDPLKLAEHVHYTLRSNKPEKALDLCRLASKDGEIVVSWNHIVDWHMSKGKVDDAIKIYNEMKKRAQFPDSYTYTILLRGLARPPHHGQPVKEANVSKAISIYNSMSSPTSRVRPSTYHTNAVLKVCSAALDMEALWGIVSNLPSSGPRAPDHITYAILLNAIRHGAFGSNPEHIHVESVAIRRNKAVQEGRGIWRDVISRWRAGEIIIDEELVCAMGRLLLMSKRIQDWDDVLNLVQQTMKIERLIPPLGSPDRHTAHVPQDNELRITDAEPEEDSEGYTDTPATKAFFPVQPLPRDSAYPDRPTSLVWVQLGNPTLSLLVGTCSLMRTPKTAVAYWDLIIGPPYGIQPDIANFHAQLRLLGKNRASAKAVELVQDGMMASGVTPKYQTFRIAMHVCVRDRENPNVIDHARALIDVMDKTSSDLDIHTLMQYLNLALGTDDGPTIISTLDRLDPIIHNLRSRVTYGADEDSHRRTPEDHLVDKEETIQFFRATVGAMDTLMNRGLVPREEFKYWHARRSQLTAFIGRAKNNIERDRARIEHVRNDGSDGEKGRASLGREEYRKKNQVGGRVAREGMVKSLIKFRESGKTQRERERNREREEEGMEVGPWGEVVKRKLGPKWRVLDMEGFADSPAELGMR